MRRYRAAAKRSLQRRSGAFAAAEVPMDGNPIERLKPALGAPW
jgi:DNA-directed RNA polymerase subunit K/omega